MVRNYNQHLGQVLKHRRVQLSLTLRELAVKSKISASHLARIEQGERFPSAHVLQRIARPLGFKEQELFVLAGFLDQDLPKTADDDTLNDSKRLDPYVASVLAGEPVEVQRAAVVIINILNSLAKNLRQR